MTIWSIGSIQYRGRFAVLLATALILDALAAIGLIAPAETDIAPGSSSWTVIGLALLMIGGPVQVAVVCRPVTRSELLARRTPDRSRTPAARESP